MLNLTVADDRSVEWLTAEYLVADEVDLDDCPLMLCLDTVVHHLLSDTSFTHTAFAVFDHNQC